jgi:hypothetical protein
MKLREAINALKMMRDIRAEDELYYLWVNELEGKVQTEIMLMDIMDVIQYSEEQYDATLMVLPPHDTMYVDWMVYKAAEYYGEYDRAQYLYATFEKKYRAYAAWYMNRYRPAEARRKEAQQWATTTA